MAGRTGTVDRNSSQSTSSLAKIQSLARSQSPEDKTNLMAAIVELGNGRGDEALQPAVQVLLATVMSNLISEAEQETRIEMVRKFLTAAWVPPRLIGLLSIGEIDIARLVIAASPVLQDSSLIELLSHGSVQHQIAVADRSNISEIVVDKIVETSHPDVLVSLLNNNTAKIDEEKFAELVNKSRKISEIRYPLANHEILNEDLSKILYNWANQKIRFNLIKRFNLDVYEMNEALKDFSSNDSNTGAPAYASQPVMPATREEDQTLRVRQLIAKLDRSGQLTPANLLRALQEGKILLFTSILSGLGRFSPEDLKFAMNAKSPDLLALACAAVGAEKDSLPLMIDMVRSLNEGSPRGGGITSSLLTMATGDVGRRFAASEFNKSVKRAHSN